MYKITRYKENVFIRPPIEKSDIPLLADHYATFVNCSTIDNTPVSTIEAMAMGINASLELMLGVFLI